jgi:hypothetical protein
MFPHLTLSLKFNFLIMLTCEFSNPVKADGTPTNNNTNPWNFKNLTCSGSLDETSSSASTTSTLPVYISTTTGDFYIQKTFTLGEIMILAFIIPAVFIISVFGIRKILTHKFING